MINVSVNGIEHRLEESCELDRLLESARSTDNLEIWSSKNSQASLGALLNNHLGWLMFLRYPGDAGFSSRNPTSDAQVGDTEAFTLANGQVDVYP